MEIFNMHKFLYSLNYNGESKGVEIIFIDRDNKEKNIILERIEIGNSQISCKLFDKENNRYLIPFIRIKKVLRNNELIFDNTDVDMSNSKIIKGFKN